MGVREREHLARHRLRVEPSCPRAAQRGLLAFRSAIQRTAYRGRISSSVPNAAAHAHEGVPRRAGCGRISSSVPNTAGAQPYPPRSAAPKRAWQAATI